MFPGIYHDLPRNGEFDRDNHVSSGVVGVKPLFRGDSERMGIDIFIFVLVADYLSRICYS
jgi:hypothetical protein